MEQALIQFLPNLGLAGFAIWILYRLQLSYQERAKEKDADLEELNKEIRAMILRQLVDNTNALNDNTKALKLIANKLSRP